MMGHGVIVSKGRTMTIIMRIFIIRTKVKQWIWLFLPTFLPLPSFLFYSLPLVHLFFFPPFLWFHQYLYESGEEENEPNEYIFIGQLLHDRHCKSIKPVDKSDMEEDPWHVPGAKSWPVQSLDLGEKMEVEMSPLQHQRETEGAVVKST